MSVPPEILIIPLLGCLVPLSWVTNSRIMTDSVDEAYLDSLIRVREVMQRAYGSVHLLGSVEAEGVRTEWTWDKAKSCLLYSGGVDSLTSFIRNIESRPTLLMVRGTPDLRLGDVEYFKRCIEVLSPACKEIGAEFHVVETDFLDILDHKTLSAHVRSEKVHAWWENFAHGLFLTGMSAPLTYSSHAGRLFIASSYTVEEAVPWGSMPESDKEVRWGVLETIHDSYDYNKFEKIREVLSPFLKSRGIGGFPLKVCTGGNEDRLASGKLNCSKCTKCLRTMLMLLENGIDPAECEFDMTKFSPRNIRIGLENGYLNLADAPLTWGYIFDNVSDIPPKMESKYRGTNALLRWTSTWNRKPNESILRSYSKKIAPVGSGRRRLAKKILRKD